MQTNWRDAASPRVQDDFGLLVGLSLDFATRQLDRHGEFFPYAIALPLDGDEPEYVAGLPEGDAPERPESTAVIELLRASLRERSAGLRAAAIVSDVLAGGQDAARVSLDHAERVSIAVLQPYASKRLSRKKHYGDLVTTEGDREIWPPTEA